MAKATWRGATLAESEHTSVIERNHYFPPESVNWEFFKPSDTTSACPWKGLASYYSIDVDGEVNADAAWQYKEPKPAAAEITGHLAFWRGVEVEG